MPPGDTAAALRERYARDGAVFPVRVTAPAEMAGLLGRLEAVEGARAGRLPPALAVKPHLLLPWLWDLVHDPRVLDPVEALLGPDLVCWASSFFAKEAGAAAHVPWHQDATYWALERPEALTAWIAFTPSQAGNGCMRVMPGTHRAPLRHRDTGDPAAMIFGREAVEAELDEAAAVDVVLAPGEMSLHHALLIHGSRPNAAGPRRVGFAIRYLPGEMRGAAGGMRGTATIVRGRDHGHFDAERAPEAELHPAARERHRRILRRWHDIVVQEVRTKTVAPAA